MTDYDYWGEMPSFRVGKNEAGWFALCETHPGFGCVAQDRDELLKSMEQLWREIVVQAKHRGILQH